jgi:lipopolysaccharide export system protein LptA
MSPENSRISGAEWRIPMKTSSAKSISILLLVILICQVPSSASTGGALILERANTNENIYNNTTGEFISYLQGDVVFLYEDVRISAENARWQKNDGIVDFYNDVVVEHRGQLMTCNRLNFSRDKDLLTATGNVLYQDSARITFIRGNTVEYEIEKKEALLRGNPLLTRLDSTDVDTLFISGRTMTYNDSLKLAVVNNNVSVRKGDLNATGQKGIYFADKDIAHLRIKPVINYENNKIIGDSVNLFLSKESLESADVIGNAYGYYTEFADSTSTDTTAVMHIWGDSLHLSMLESGKVNFMKTFGNSRGNYTEFVDSLGRTTETKITSDSLHIFMSETGKLSAIKAFGNAHGNYHEISDTSNAVTSTNIMSDSLHMFMFETGKMSAMKAFGSARENYYEFSPVSNTATSTNITSDSLHVFMFETGKINAMKAFGNAHVRNSEFSETPPSSQSPPPSSPNDSTITHVWSDSLHVQISEAGKMSIMRAFNNVISKNFVLGDSAKTNEISGQRMTLAFTVAGRIEKAIVRGNAKSIYFIDESDGGGCNKASGDIIVVLFSRGKAQRILARGKAKGIYFPSESSAKTPL